MENNISNKLKIIISENEFAFKNDSIIEIYEKAIKDFDVLVKKGFAKKRENNLLSFNESHLHRITLDTYNNNPTQNEYKINGFESFNTGLKLKNQFNTIF